MIKTKSHFQRAHKYPLITGVSNDTIIDYMNKGIDVSNKYNNIYFSSLSAMVTDTSIEYFVIKDEDFSFPGGIYNIYLDNQLLIGDLSISGYNEVSRHMSVLSDPIFSGSDFVRRLIWLAKRFGIKRLVLDDHSRLFVQKDKSIDLFLGRHLAGVDSFYSKFGFVNKDENKDFKIWIEEMQKEVGEMAKEWYSRKIPTSEVYEKEMQLESEGKLKQLKTFKMARYMELDL